ncbi:mechanosensitive ion channel protein [[Clostridium] sordellii]|uniref:mechanosensitive ion channel family protein n=1 Tax=Paraclostridium sordellii TaxID=1505 RepID=UPI0005E6F119|nr:mechanosensitive ion channel family protein [Paeniclostridium sordellii]MRZ27368.1 mechanosensitive ion channel [Paeniclostridium sordellii]MVO73506.1 mechanosensitive ion channel [Paeniclostridium sordellii]CEO36487.1 mechanosensitive ion channel protein [[Clostridium] sordellii] [Paeniclostridium sordellii]CEP82015.1 mechanosensitive ion channel protein [[Clostridium] sordellii] [Paeniclostridium sordellii]CEP94718.1 mechanosensitive ion channel protein [[Clostridium] sordellii] [Paeniclo
MILARIINSIIIILCAYILLKLIQYFLKKLFELTRFDVRYENTLSSVLCSMAYYIIFILTIILLLKEFNIVDVTKFGTLVTGASIVGLIAGVASQSILKDIFNGFFIIFEKQIQVGDFVILNEEFRGTVEEIGLRSTSLRDWDLRRVTIPNGNILSIRNYSRNTMRVVVNVRVSYEEDPMKIINALEEVCDILNERHKEILSIKKNKESYGKFKVYGVTDIEESPIGAKYTITGIVQSNKYFKVLKDTKLQILITFKDNGINIAYPTHINVIKDNIND